MDGIYLDHGATSFPKPEACYAAIEDFMRNNGASPGRGTYQKAMQSEQLVYDTRKALAGLMGIKRPSEIVFACNATEAINLAIKGCLEPGDTVLTSNIEHNAMYRPIKSLERERDVRVLQFHCCADGNVDMQEVEELLGQKPKLLALLHGSNVLGCILPIRELAALAHQYGALVLVDCAQTAGAYPLHAVDMGIDMLAFTGHKSLLGPTGTGGLYIREGLQLKTYREGGTGSMAKSPYQPEKPPDRYEAGTLNILGLAGLHASAHYLLEMGVEQIRAHEQELMAMLIDGLAANDRIILYGSRNPEERLGLLSFNIDGIDPYEVARRLDQEYGILVRAGLHCAPQAHTVLGTQDTGAVRVSTGFTNTAEEMETLLSAIKQIAKG